MIKCKCVLVGISHFLAISLEKQKGASSCFDRLGDKEVRYTMGSHLIGIPKFSDEVYMYVIIWLPVLASILVAYSYIKRDDTTPTTQLQSKIKALSFPFNQSSH